MSITLQFIHRINGVLTNATSVLLADPTGTFAVKRNDTLAVVTPPAALTAITNVSAGVYTYVLTEPAVGLTYTWWARYVYGGITNHAEFQATGTGVTPLGDYCDRGDIEDIFGVGNTATYSQLESHTDGSFGSGADTGRIQRGIDYADARINASMSPYYTVPMTALAAPADDVVRRWAATLAGCWMFRSRTGQYEAGAPGRPGKDNRGSHYAAWEKEIWAEIRMYQLGAASGHLLLTGATRSASRVPAVADAYGTGVTTADLARRQFRDAWRYGPWYRDAMVNG